MLHIYFKRIEVSGKNKIPSKTPKIFVTNHQNAFLDAIILGCLYKEKLHFLTRASVFKKPLVRWLLSQINMLPIYRIRDGISAVKKNDEVFEICIDILQKKGNLLIFAEGNHGLQRNLRPLQKGVSRIALETENRNGFNLGVTIVPIGMNYDKHWAFRNNFYMNVGEPFLVSEYKEVYRQDTNEAMNKLKDKLANHLRPLILNIDKDNYEEVEEKWLKHRKNQKSLSEQFIYDQQLIDAIESGEEMEELGEAPSSKSLYWLNPFYWYAVINHFFPFLIIKKILNPIKDRAFWSSLKFALGYILVPLFYCIQFLLVYYISNNLLLSIGYLISMPLVGIAVYDYYKSDAL